MAISPRDAGYPAGAAQRAGSNLQPEHREVMAKSAKVRITGHQCSLVFDGQGRSKAVDTVELVLGLDLGGTERSLGCGVHQADGQCMHSAHGCDRSVQPMSAKDSAIDLSVVHR